MGSAIFVASAVENQYVGYVNKNTCYSTLVFSYHCDLTDYGFNNVFPNIIVFWFTECLFADDNRVSSLPRDCQDSCEFGTV